MSGKFGKNWCIQNSNLYIKSQLSFGLDWIYELFKIYGTQKLARLRDFCLNVAQKCYAISKGIETKASRFGRFWRFAFFQFKVL